MKLLVPLCLLMLASCDEMAVQPRYDDYEPSALFADGKAMQSPPAGTVSRDAPARLAALRERPRLTLELLERGRERFDIYCTPCHGYAGYGDGTVPARGFPKPPSFHIERLRDAPSEHFVQVITDGHGVMYSYADRVPPADRWAIAGYIRALQASQGVPVDVLPDAARAELEANDAR